MPDSDTLRVSPLLHYPPSGRGDSLPPSPHLREVVPRTGLCPCLGKTPAPCPGWTPGASCTLSPWPRCWGGRQRISALVVTVLYSDVPRVPASSFLAHRVVLWWERSQAVLPAHPRSPSHEPSLGRGAPAVTVSSAHTSPPTTGSSSTESLCVPGTTLSPCGPASCCG